MSALRENTNGFLDDNFEEELEQQMFGLDLDDDNDEEENHNHNYNDNDTNDTNALALERNLPFLNNEPFYTPATLESCIDDDDDEDADEDAPEDEEDEDQADFEVEPCPICFRVPGDATEDDGAFAVDHLCAVKGCQHKFCLSCIVTWAELRDPAPPSCPTCKQDFTHIYVNRTEDGVPTGEFFREEHITVLRTVSWIQKDALALKGKKPATWVGEDDAMRPAFSMHDAYDDDYESDGDYDGAEYEDRMSHKNKQALRRMRGDGSSSGGSSSAARRIVGNRRWGSGGYVAGGRVMARPVVQPHAASPSTPTNTQSSGAVAVPSGKGKGVAMAASPSACGGASPSPSSKPVNKKAEKRAAKAEEKLRKEAEKAERRRLRVSGGGKADVAKPDAVEKLLEQQEEAENFLTTATDSTVAI